MSEEKKVIGTVKWFNPEKGYGFITVDDGTEYFIHYTGISIDGRKDTVFSKRKKLLSLI